MCFSRLESEAITRGTDKLTNSVLLVTLCLSNACTQDVAEVIAIRMRRRAVFSQHASYCFRSAVHLALGTRNDDAEQYISTLFTSDQVKPSA